MKGDNSHLKEYKQKSNWEKKFLGNIQVSPRMNYIVYMLCCGVVTNGIAHHTNMFSFQNTQVLLNLNT